MFEPQGSLVPLRTKCGKLIQIEVLATRARTVIIENHTQLSEVVDHIVIALQAGVLYQATLRDFVQGRTLIVIGGNRHLDPATGGGNGDTACCIVAGDGLAGYQRLALCGQRCRGDTGLLDVDSDAVVCRVVITGGPCDLGNCLAGVQAGATEHCAGAQRGRSAVASFLDG